MEQIHTVLWLLDDFQKLIEHLVEFHDTLSGQIDALGHFGGDVQSTILQGLALLGDGDDQVALVLLTAAAADESLFLQLFQQGRQRSLPPQRRR